jgi:tRNA G18 (ribose-2'-O)-methylase SpoU
MTAVSHATADDLELFSSLRGNRCPDGCFIGDGSKVVRRMLKLATVTRILCTPEWVDRLQIPAETEVRTASKEELDRIVGYRLHQGVMAIARRPDPPPLRGSLLVALDGLDNAENVGAVMRSCAAFGVEGVIVGPGTASPWLRRAVRTSIAAPLQVPVHFTDDLAGSLRSLRAYAAHIHGERVDYRDIDFRGEVCLILGGEANGVSDEALKACRGTIYIPMSNGWDCLNVAASAAVLLAEVTRQRRSS